MQELAQGQLVRIAPQWRDSPEEGESLYRVIEDRGDRCLIELVCDLPIPPQEVVRKEMIELANSGHV